MIVNSTDIKTNFGKYLDLVQKEDIVITRNKKPVAILTKYSKYRDIIKDSSGDYIYDNSEITYDEFIEVYKNTDGRFEYLDGVVYQLIPPSHTHQHIISCVIGEFYTYFKDKNCKPYVGPYDIYFNNSPTKDIVQPDIFVICDHENIRNDRYFGIPDLIVEVTSPSTRNNDLVKKLNLYLQSGIKEYVIFDTKNKNVVQWNFNNKQVQKCNTIAKMGVYKSNIFDGLEINLSIIFQ
ncbi:type II toxin-antitoxin system Phd/YefM family antitoxin [Vallitalea sp.]|jgi:prevent-host-death family protein|uniref:type II toxin-antitoxin system Phd/YefM family antitoxin n=1 Tax=Vallitalea sp. TaxID=1882829 RepID=UPI0025DFC0F4|nr:type II toxin-antitoxin system Phd/YefM family antitoxin [Vallitalea sp.]MCT4688495.1 type II toxin-antitoxin system Phd/YefM family antitoxin [Vallitalea sp.]